MVCGPNLLAGDASHAARGTDLRCRQVCAIVEFASVAWFGSRYFRGCGASGGSRGPDRAQAMPVPSRTRMAVCHCPRRAACAPGPPGSDRRVRAGPRAWPAGFISMALFPVRNAPASQGDVVRRRDNPAPLRPVWPRPDQAPDAARIACGVARGSAGGRSPSRSSYRTTIQPPPRRASAPRAGGVPE